MKRAYGKIPSMETYETHLITNLIMAGAGLSVTESAPSRKCVINPRPSCEVQK
jgi:hypothetical protein